ncbi:sensor histidine kinase [Deminuibacter soli]|nr:histidine kinase [Deminuibacter soli]
MVKNASAGFALLADIDITGIVSGNALLAGLMFLLPGLKQMLVIWYGELLLTAFCGASLLIYVRHVYDRKKEKMAYHNRLLEMQAKALTNQMNPHFIYNSLSTVQHLIMIDEKQKAFDYISDFSLLMRQMLTNTRKSYISLDDEVDFLKRYLELEKIRFINAFQYEFHIDEDLRSNSYCIPSMLIQPILENAIKHGFSPKRENNLLKVTMVAQNDLVICSVDDNGIGWKKKNSDFTTTIKHESTALTILRERLNLIKSYNGNSGNLEIIDKFLADNQQTGTIVKIYIPIINSL